MLNIVGYDPIANGKDGLRFAWACDHSSNYVESAAFVNKTKGELGEVCGYTTSVSSGCILRTQGLQCTFCRTGNRLPFGGLLTSMEIAKQNVFMVLADMYCSDHPELANKKREFAYMGQGEPGFSYSQVRIAIELTNAVMRELHQTVHRHIFATCGVPETIYAVKEDLNKFFTERVTLHFSLHAGINRSLLMPINSIYPYKDSIEALYSVADITGEKPCVGILLFDRFEPKGKNFTYSTTKDDIAVWLKNLDSKKIRLSFCEYNASPDLGNSATFLPEVAEEILEMAVSMGFEAKLFSSFGQEEQTACGMLGAKQPVKIASAKWKELETMAEELLHSCAKQIL